MNRDRLTLTWCLTVSLAAHTWSLSAQELEPSLELANGQWFDAAGFVAGTVYVVDGLFSTAQPERVDRVIDLAGGFVIPPFAEAHTHSLADRPERAAEFMRRGIFFAGIQNTFRSVADSVRPKFNGPDSVDARFAIAALTASDAHPLQIGLAQGRSVEELDGDWLHLVDSVEELDRKWPSVLASGTDIVKVFLVNSHEYGERRGNPAVAIRHRGIDPSLIPRMEGLGVFDRAELLRRATADTIRSLFPARRLGSLADGFEASFIVLGRNPLDGFDALDDITLRVKRGRVLSPSS